MAGMGFLPLGTPPTHTTPCPRQLPTAPAWHTLTFSSVWETGKRESELPCSSGRTAQGFSKYQVDGGDEPLGSGIRGTCIQIPLSTCSSATSGTALHLSGPSFSKNSMRITTLPSHWPVMTTKVLKRKVSVELHKSLTPDKPQLPHPINGEMYPSILFHWLVKNKQLTCGSTL